MKCCDIARAPAHQWGRAVPLSDRVPRADPTRWSCFGNAPDLCDPVMTRRHEWA